MGEHPPGDDYIDLPADEVEDFYSDEDLFQISSWGADLSFRELIARYDENELVKPELQRNYIWGKPEASRFIDSILLGLPVPSIFLAKTANEKLLIIDGFQRLMTVRDYVKGVFSKDGSVFKLSRSDRIHDRWKGKAFTELDGEEQRRIRNTTIHAIIFMQRHPAKGDTSLFQVFERINSGGRTLLAQEIRNCVYQGPVNDLLIELNDDATWRSLYGKAQHDDRMRDMEYILRFFGLSRETILFDEDAPTRVSLKKYLNQYMDDANKSEDANDLRDRFLTAVSWVKATLGENAFHNVSHNPDVRYIRKFSPTIFDSVLISFDMAVRRGVDISAIDGLEERRLRILGDDDFQGLLYQETMRVGNIRRRVFSMYGALFGEEP